LSTTWEDEEGLGMGFIKARGNSFYYQEQGEGPPILLIAPAGATCPARE
jgi:hypothetical protein